MFVYTDEHQIIPTNPNRAYPTGNAYTFWRLDDWRSGSNPNGGAMGLVYPVGSGSRSYNTGVIPRFRARGMELRSPYSPNHAKVNDIVIHTPVSVQDAIVISLPPERDQRSVLPPGAAQAIQDNANALRICPLEPGRCEFRVLNCQFFVDVPLANFTFDSGAAVNSITGQTHTLPTGFTVENANRFGSGRSLNAFGTRWSIPFSDIGLANTRDTVVLVEMDIEIPPAGTNPTMVVSFQGYNFYIPVTSGSGVGTFNTGNHLERQVNKNFIGSRYHLGLQFSFGSIEDSKIFVNGVEFTNITRVAPSNSLEGRIGNMLSLIHI